MHTVADAEKSECNVKPGEQTAAGQVRKVGTICPVHFRVRRL